MKGRIDRLRIFYRINDIPLKLKFLLIYLLCVLVPIMSINVFFYYRNSEDIQLREKENLRKSMERASGELLGMIEESVALDRSIASDDSIYEALDREYESPIEYYKVYNSFLRDRMTRYKSDNILQVRVYTNNLSIQSGTNYQVIESISKDLPWLEQLNRSRVNILTVAYDEKSGFNPGQRISVVSRMNTFSSYSKYMKFVRIDLNIEKIESILNREIDSLKLRLLDEKGRTVASSPGLEAEGADSVRPAAGYTMNHAIGDFSYVKNWRLVGVADTHRIDSLLHDAFISIVWLAVLSTLIPSLLIFILFRSYHYRVKKLSRHMEKVRNERFDLIDIQEGRDEIGGLIRTFNVMIEKITSLINDVYKLEIRQKNMELETVRTELSMLQSQMNPHFLFNTLNALLIVCVKNGYTGVTGIIKNLSVLMRQLLSGADGLVPLREELEFTSMYLQIEKFRFGDLFNYSFHIDPEAMDLLIPRMSIQPLVENACKHGLQARKEARTISIAAKLTELALEVHVRDNGIGMEEDKLKRLMENVRVDNAMDGRIGIRNVYRRLELFYHANVRFILESSPGLGTDAGFHIPLSRLLSNEEEGISRVHRPFG